MTLLVRTRVSSPTHIDTVTHMPDPHMRYRTVILYVNGAAVRIPCRVPLMRGLSSRAVTPPAIPVSPSQACPSVLIRGGPFHSQAATPIQAIRSRSSMRVDAVDLLECSRVLTSHAGSSGPPLMQRET